MQYATRVSGGGGGVGADFSWPFLKINKNALIFEKK